MGNFIIWWQFGRRFYQIVDSIKVSSSNYVCGSCTLQATPAPMEIRIGHVTTRFFAHHYLLNPLATFHGTKYVVRLIILQSWDSVFMGSTQVVCCGDLAKTTIQTRVLRMHLRSLDIDHHLAIEQCYAWDIFGESSPRALI